MRASVFTGFDQVPVPVTLAWDDPAQVIALIRTSTADASSLAAEA